MNYYNVYNVIFNYCQDLFIPSSSLILGLMNSKLNSIYFYIRIDIMHVTSYPYSNYVFILFFLNIRYIILKYSLKSNGYSKFPFHNNIGRHQWKWQENLCRAEKGTVSQNRFSKLWISFTRSFITCGTGRRLYSSTLRVFGLIVHLQAMRWAKRSVSSFNDIFLSKDDRFRSWLL